MERRRRSNQDGKHLGTVVGDRLLRRRNSPYRYPGYPGYPGYAGYQSMPFGFENVPEGLLQDWQGLASSAGYQRHVRYRAVLSRRRTDLFSGWSRQVSDLRATA